MTGNTSVHIPIEAESWYVQRNWERLDGLCDGIFDCPHSTPVLTDDGPFVARSQDIRSGVFRVEEAGHVSEETYQERIARAEPSVGDLLYSREGTYFGIAAEVPPDTRMCLGQRMVLIRPKPRQLNSRFLRLWLNSPMLTRHIEGFRDGTVAERLNMPTIRGLPIPLFNIEEQKAIADVLGTFDDKIDLNRRMNETLEMMARTIFKDWFVDFGPTHAKAEGRPPYLALDLWSLFPDALDDDDKPVGWETSIIGKETKCVGGATPSTSDPSLWNGGVHWVTPKDLSILKSPILLSTDRTISKSGLAKISSGLLPVGTVLLSSRAPIGYIAIAEVQTAINQGFIALICDGRLSTVFVWQWIRANMEAILQNANGSTFQEISKANFRPLEVIVPGFQLLRAFNDAAVPLYQRIRNNELENQTLAQLRDLLLPKLMSGAIRLKTAEKAVGEHI